MDTRPTLSRAILGGFVGTLAMTVMMYFVAPMIGLRMDIAAMLGSLVGHVLYGSLFGVIARAPETHVAHA